MTRQYIGKLEIDDERGVIYFHLLKESDINQLGAVTLLRICRLPTPIPARALDITYGVGCDWAPKCDCGAIATHGKFCYNHSVEAAMERGWSIQPGTIDLSILTDIEGTPNANKNASN